MTGALQVRAAEPDDAEVVARMAAKFHAFHKAPGGLSADIIRKDGFGPERWFDIVIAELGGEPAGYALFHKSYETGHAAPGFYLSDLWVEPDARRCGIGSALLRAVAQAGQACGAHFIWLVVQNFNTEALAYYEGLGAGGDTVEARALMIGDLLTRLKA
jgi:ribosomal protein S18 acetylase RimI-like enzyme